MHDPSTAAGVSEWLLLSFPQHSFPPLHHLPMKIAWILTDFLNLSQLKDHMGSVRHKGLIYAVTHDSTYDINSIYTDTLTTNKKCINISI